MVALAFDSSAYQPDAANDDEPRWVTAYHDALNAVRTAGKGSRNPTLNAQAFIIGRIVAAGHVKEKDAQADLEAAAADAGIMHGDERAKSVDTIKRGLAAGAKNPWEENGAGAARNATVVSRESDAASVSRDRNGPNDTRSPAMKDISPEAATGEPITKAERARIELAIHNHERAKPANGTPGEAYLMGRGINILPPECRWDGAGLVLPLIDSRGKVTALHRIPINKDLSRGQKVTQGKMSDGVFKIAATDPECNIWVVTDGPEDALTCAEATGWHAAAVCGKTRMYHIAAHVPHGATVVLCRDADEEAGPAYDRALRALCNHLCTGIIADPPEGLQTDRFEPVKDANDIAQRHGTEKVKDWLLGVLARDPLCIEPESEEAEEEEHVEEDPDIETLPEPSGLLRDVVEWTLSTQRRRNPELALGAALIAVGTAAARRYRADGNITPNLYLMGLAPSGGGKEGVIACTEAMLDEAGLSSALAGGQPASGAAVMSRILSNPTSVYLVDEFAHLLREMANPKGSPHLREISKAWTEIFTKSVGTARAKDYADRKSTNSGDVCAAPHLSVFGLTNAAALWEGVTTTAIGDGSIARYVVLGDPDRREPPERRPAPRVVPEDMAEALRLLAHREGVHGVASIKPDWFEVRITADADDAFWTFESVEQEAALSDAAMAPVYARMTENAKRLALIHALGRFAVGELTEPVITEADAVWGISVMRILAARMVKRIGRHVAKNDNERAHKDLLEVIRKAGRKGISASELTNKTQWLKALERKDIIDVLHCGGRISVETARPKGKGAGRATTTFKYVK